MRVAAEHGLPFAQLAVPIRLALTGTTSAPGVADLMAVLGRDETIVRLQAAL